MHAIVFLFFWEYFFGRFIAFGGRLSSLWWMFQAPAEGWYSLTKMLYRPYFVVYIFIHFLFFIVHTLNINVFAVYILAPAHTLFSYWTPSFLEDFIDFGRAATVGLAIFMLLIATLMTQAAQSADFFVTLSILMLFVYVYAQCVHAAIIIKTKVSTVDYEHRTLNQT